MADDSIKKLSDIHENLAPPGYSFQQRDDHVKFFKLVDNEMLLPEVTECIRTDKELDVKLLFKEFTSTFTSVVSTWSRLSSYP